MSAWLQGLYISHAIEACFSENRHYPKKPLHIFDDDGAEPEEIQAEERAKAEGKANQDMITAQILQVQSYFKKQQESELHREPQE